MGTFQNTPASKADLVKGLDKPVTPSYTDVISRDKNQAVDKTEKVTPRKSVRQSRNG